MYRQQEGVYNMMHGGQTIDLFKLQSELVDAKVDMAVSRTIDRVVDQISALRNDMNGIREDMHGLRHEMRDGFASLGTRVTAIETKLGMKQETKAQIKSKVIEYTFRAISAISALGFAYVVLHL
jgi:hypothetical protein